MHFTKLPLIFSSIPLVLAQYGYGDSGSGTTTSTSASASSTPSQTSSGSSTVHTVQVGNGGLKFSPNSFSANVGDTVEFHFYGPEHSVAQSTFASPCQPASNSSFFSGPISTTGTGPNSEVYTLTVNNTDAIWIYCAVPSHCENGMAAVINAPSDGSKTLSMYQQAALNVANTVAPSVVQGGVLGTPGTSSSTSSGVSSSTSSSASSTPTTKSAGVETRGEVRWPVLVLTGLVAVGFGSLIM